MSQTTDASCDSVLGEQQTIAERNEVYLSSIVSPMAGIKQVADCSYSAERLCQGDLHTAVWSGCTVPLFRKLTQGGWCVADYS